MAADPQSEKQPEAAAEEAAVAELAADVAPDDDAAAADASDAPADGAAQADGAQQVEADLDALQAKARERDEFLALAQRTQADFENFRKRAARDASAAQERGIKKVVGELLPALDDLGRALQAAGDDQSDVVKGFRLVGDRLDQALKAAGVERFSPRGEAFDPTLHEAIAQQPVEGVDSGVVAEVYQDGFRLGETVIRPARVVVAA